MKSPHQSCNRLLSTTAPAVNRSMFSLPPGFHIPVALVLTFALSFSCLDAACVRLHQLHQANHAALADYHATIAVAIGFTSLLIFLPRTGNTSSFALVRTLGRLTMLVRYFLAAGIAMGLIGLGNLLEKYAS